MKTLLAVLLATILGIAAGVGIAYVRIAACPWDRGTSPPDAAASGPKVAIDEEVHEFGSMDVRAKGTHDFVLTNTGNAALELTIGKSSCGCTVGELPNPTIAPGKSGKVTVTWTVDRETGPYRQTVNVETNDPARPRVQLVVSGRITTPFVLTPRSAAFGEVPMGQSASTELQLLSYFDEPLKLTGYEIDEKAMSPYYDVTFEPLTADQLNEAPTEELETGKTGKSGDMGATGIAGSPSSGYRVRITVKPGLPQGTFRQKIALTTDRALAPEVPIHVEGTIVGDISIVGAGWDAERKVLNLDTISSAAGAERRLVLVARGPHAQDVKFSLERCIPDWLEVDEAALGRTTTFGAGKATQTPLIIRIPQGAPRAKYLGGELGEILLETTHPEMPQLRLRVRFAVEG